MPDRLSLAICKASWPCGQIMEGKAFGWLACRKKINVQHTHTHKHATQPVPRGPCSGAMACIMWSYGYSTCMHVCLCVSVCVGMCTNKHGNASRTGAWEPGLLPPQAAVGLRLMPIYIVAYFRAQWPMASSLPVSWPSAHVRLPLF